MNHINVFEVEARARKVARLLDAADEMARANGVDPWLNAVGIADAWRKATPAHFAALVKQAGINKPSPVTMREFQDALNHRAGL